MFGIHTHLTLPRSFSPGTCYCTEVLLPHVCLFRDSIRTQFLFLNNSTPLHIVAIKEQLDNDVGFGSATPPSDIVPSSCKSSREFGGRGREVGYPDFLKGVLPQNLGVIEPNILSSERC
ncbi:hypothetical protein TNCV_998701 [Trichonephila clavipes]|nr:hypothetical protein TNCV_998701 [Trichonephila clavipes]